ncbi:MAG: sugar phosphate isomerase/epimerase [Candidatus Rokubacteria bacterium]|nr:sugar phosphate isomerase/epimerase [Candidatus Rokubacteria bacterium]
MTRVTRPADLRERIGIDLGGKIRLEDGLEWARAHGVRYVDTCLDRPGEVPSPLESLTPERAASARAFCERHGIHLGLHTLSAVNVAETSPFLATAADRYLEAYVEAARSLGAAWVVVHGGYHFSSDYETRRTASLERLERAVARAERAGVRLLLENLNREPEHAEVHYLAFNLEECRHYFGRIASPHLGWAFTVNHAHLVPEGVDGFLDAMDLGRCGEIRLADNTGEYEVHLYPGQGTIDFGRVFQRVEAAGYRGHYMLAFGSREDMLRGREDLAALDPAR